MPAPTFQAHPLDDLWRRPFPHLRDEPLTRWLVRGSNALARRRWIEGAEGLEHVLPERDPFVLVSNHNQRPETVLLNGLLAHVRGGRMVHFLADWPMMLVPGVSLLYRRGRIVPVFGKKPKVRLLAGLERRYRARYPGSAWERSRALLDAGGSIGVFPESTMNRNRRRMLRGRPGAALLAIEAGVPVVPVGLRFASSPDDRPIGDGESFTVHVGPPIPSPEIERDDPKAAQVASRAFHRVLMREISELCGKSWTPDSARRKDAIARRD